MQVTVIIPTYNGAHKIVSTLRSLENQSVKPNEVLVIVDGSTDGTTDLLKRQSFTFPSFSIIEQKNGGRAKVRNSGAKEAKGDLLVFFDDDMEPLQDCIAKHVNHHTKHPLSILTGGLSERVNTKSSEILKYKSHLSNKWNSSLQRTEEGELLKSSLFITAANFSIQKDVFNKTEGFDEQLRDAEDFDLAVRAYKKGVPLYFKEDAFAWHNDMITCKSYIKRQRQYTAAHKMLIDLKPWMATEGFIVPLMKPSGWKKKIFQLFLNKQLIDAIDSDFFKALPEKMKYKLYDLVITANGIFYPEKVSL